MSTNSLLVALSAFALSCSSASAITSADKNLDARPEERTSGVITAPKAEEKLAADDCNFEECEECAAEAHLDSVGEEDCQHS